MSTEHSTGLASNPASASGATSGPDLDFDTPELRRYRKRRALKDKLAGVSIAAGGMSVIVAVSLIFFYLLWEVLPLFRGASMDEIASYHSGGGRWRSDLVASGGGAGKNCHATDWHRSQLLQDRRWQRCFYRRSSIQR